MVKKVTKKKPGQKTAVKRVAKAPADSSYSNYDKKKKRFVDADA